MNDFNEVIHSYINEEEADIKKYLEMSRVLASAGKEKASKVLNDIAKEEMTHRRYLAELL